MTLSFIVFFILSVNQFSKKAGNFYKYYGNQGPISCMEQGGYWSNGMCSSVSLPGSVTLNYDPFYYYGYYPFGFPYYSSVPYRYGFRHPRPWPRRKYYRRYGGYL